ncbi:MAG: pilin [Patescibacteria group bacterium]|nr:pilin [Patescibacteria group bacterium]
MMKNRKIFLLFSFILLFFLILASKFVLASDSLGIEAVDNTIVLESTDPRSIIVKIINVALGFLAIIAVSLAIFGGFLWMTSEGNEEKVSKAKRVLKNALIGLIIVLSAWGIVTFIFRSLFSDGQSNNGNISPGQAFFQNGLGAIGACSLESVYPAPRQKAVPRNTMIMATFKEEVSSSTISTSSVIICEEGDFDVDKKTCSQSTGFSVNTLDNKIFTFTPSNYLGNENSFTNYIVYFTNDILVVDESRSIFDNCSGNYFLWDFEVSNVLDLTPPKINSIFPQPDNLKDSLSIISATPATASISFLTNNFNTYQPASVVSVTPLPGSVPANVSILGTYNGNYTSFEVVVDSNGNKAQLFGKDSSSGNISLGVFDIIPVSNVFDFTGYFKLIPSNITNPSVIAGNSWDVEVSKKVESDYVILNSLMYNFTNGNNSGSNIKIGASVTETATNLVNAINTLDSSIEAVLSTTAGVINLTNKIAGLNGNLFSVSSSDSNKIVIQPFSGGANSVESVNINDKKDKPMNSIIQINFNEAINPLRVSGESYEIFDTIRIVNNSASAKDNGEVCSQGGDCRSLKCNNSSCVGNFLSGRFQISSDYKTVEFKSDNLCGVNACGEDIYCLPSDSNLKVEIEASNLFNCSGDNSNCSNKSPFSTCTNNICTDSNGKFYSLADINANSGVVDASFNSFDGNSDGYSNGPASFYYKNSVVPGSGDNLSWSFWINDKIESDPPQITSIFPGIDDVNIDLWAPVKIGFNKLMMASTLRTGEIIMNNGIGDVAHRLINLLSGQLVGYWIGAENIDDTPLDGEPDKTNAYINHAQFFEGASYFPQIGSGVKDIYQNCFKPSVGLNCSATAQEPYCCNGVPSVNPCD